MNGLQSLQPHTVRRVINDVHGITSIEPEKRIYYVTLSLTHSLAHLLTLPTLTYLLSIDLFTVREVVCGKSHDGNLGGECLTRHLPIVQ